MFEIVGESLGNSCGLSTQHDERGARVRCRLGVYERRAEGRDELRLARAVLPGDDRQAAASEAKETENWRYDMTYLQCMYAKGN